MSVKINSVDIGKRTKKGYRTVIRNDHKKVRINKMVRTKSEAMELADKVHDG